MAEARVPTAARTPVATAAPPEGASFIGVDVGGTKLAAAILAPGLPLGKATLEPTSQDSADALVEQIAALVEALRTPEVVGVGLGVPSVVEFATGTVRSSVNVPLQGVALREVLRERLGMAVYVDNDATVAALAEAHDPDGRLVVNDLVMLTVGTGVGGGLILGGEVYRGATGAAGELGHTVVGAALAGGPAAPASGDFPQPASLEAAAAGSALDVLAREAAAEHPDSALGRLAAGGDAVEGPEVVAAAQDGDPVAVALLRRLGAALGLGVANAINTFDPEVVAIGGGASRAGDLLLEPAREIALGYVLPGVGTHTEIRLARHGAEAGVLGAALMAGQEYAKAKQKEVVT